MKINDIFISIAAYRDPELLPTIRDCIKKAKRPENIRFGISWQKDDSESLEEFEDHPNVKIIESNWRDSKGACWARHAIQKNLYNNEKYYLKLDSHHRFDENWDEILISLHDEAKKKSVKPLIGCYATTYWPDKPDEALKNEPYKINTFDSFGNDGDIISRPVYMINHMSVALKERLVSARLLSGHFIFGDGAFSQECMYDPNYYFRGEEIVLSARAFTHGYDFYHPTKTVIWHEYLRKEQHKHWIDHTKDNGFITEGEQRNVRSKERQRKLLGIEESNIDFKNYGLGTIRSLHDYELFAGLDFKNKRVHKYCTDIRSDSPNPYTLSEEDWNKGMLESYEITVEWDLDKIPDDKEFDFWFFGFENTKGVLLHRKDFNNEDVYYSDFFTKKKNKHTSRFASEERPNHCVIIPHIKNGDWTKKIIIPI